ncbi:MAG: ketoacyl-ACP synthase III [Deltaproteobacteria bacterium]|nr:ketoacyl-ACP synthase III [Deltaproteobacteria bacterium]
MQSRIIGTGAFVPGGVLTNKTLEKMVVTSDEWIVSRTGIKERRRTTNKEASSDLAYYAAQRALKNAGVKPDRIDLVITATATPDMLLPSTACLVQGRLGMRNVPAFDLNAVCSGFIYGLAAADAFIRSGTYKTVLLIGVDTITKFTNYKDRSTCIIFGDGAGAVVLQAARGKKGILGSQLYADGTKWDYIHVPGGGSRIPSYAAAPKDYFMIMKGHDTFRVAVRGLEQAIIALLRQARISMRDIDIIIPHQANIRIIEALAIKLHYPMEKIFVNIDKYGNTSAASIPIALHEAVAAKRIRDNDLILFAAFGSGLTWGASLVKW